MVFQSFLINFSLETSGPGIWSFHRRPSCKNVPLKFIECLFDLSIALLSDVPYKLEMLFHLVVVIDLFHQHEWKGVVKIEIENLYDIKCINLSQWWLYI